MKDVIDIKKLKVAIIAEELTQLGGAEKVLDAMLEMFPKAPIYTLVWDKEKTQHRYDKFDVRPSFIQKMPFAIKKYKWYLPFMPAAVESFDLKDFDLIISSSSALIKGVKTHKNQIHICYCHTPTRYLWSDSDSYLLTAPVPGILKPLVKFVFKFLRKWDLKASARPDFFIANAQNIRRRIQKYYHRDSAVIYPPVECDKFKISDNLGDYFLFASRLEPYKKADLVIEAFNDMPDKKLKIVGSGTKKEEWQKLAKSNVEFCGRLSDEDLAKTFSRCLAFIFPPEEDFGIALVEAEAAGRPVIAFGKGGSLETVIPGVTGEFFLPQTPEALKKIIKNFDPKKYNPQTIRKQALKFDKSIFKQELEEYIKDRVTKLIN